MIEPRHTWRHLWRAFFDGWRNVDGYPKGSYVS